MEAIKAVLFDCDGTLVDSEYAHYLAWRHAVQKQGGDLSLEEYYFYVGQASETNARQLAKKIGKECADEIFKDKIGHYKKLQAEGVAPIVATVDFVHRLEKEKERLGLKLGVASAVEKEEILVNLRHLGIENYFDLVLSGFDDLGEYSHPEGVNKPRPFIYLHAMKLLGVKPSECVVIEDSGTGVAASVGAGCITVAVPNNFSCRQDLSRAHLRIDSLADFTVESFLQQAQASYAS